MHVYLKGLPKTQKLEALWKDARQQLLSSEKACYLDDHHLQLSWCLIVPSNQIVICRPCVWGKQTRKVLRVSREPLCCTSTWIAREHTYVNTKLPYCFLPTGRFLHRQGEHLEVRLGMLYQFWAARRILVIKRSHTMLHYVCSD